MKKPTRTQPSGGDRGYGRIIQRVGGGAGGRGAAGWGCWWGTARSELTEVCPEPREHLQQRLSKQRRHKSQGLGAVGGTRTERQPGGGPELPGGAFYRVSDQEKNLDFTE